MNEIRYVLASIYNANAEVEQVQVLRERSELTKNTNFLEKNRIVLAGDLIVFVDVG